MKLNLYCIIGRYEMCFLWKCKGIKGQCHGILKGKLVVKMHVFDWRRKKIIIIIIIISSWVSLTLATNLPLVFYIYDFSFF
jgi:hypothetical protein